MNRYAFPGLTLVLLAQTSVGADAVCSARLDKLAPPEFPTSNAAQRAISEGPCAVDVIFSLSAKGDVNVMAAGSSSERCEVFETSAKNAVAASTFAAGGNDGSCTMQISFTANERNTMAQRRPPGFADAPI